MWFSFPDGTSGCSIEGQNFSAEFQDKEKREWFRAPDHFAPKILGMGIGYSSLAPGVKPDGCDVDDLTPTFGAIGAQIGEQAQVIASLKGELMLANESLQKLAAQQRQAESEVAMLRAANTGFEKTSNDLRARIGDFESEQETRDALAKTGGKK